MTAASSEFYGYLDTLIEKAFESGEKAESFTPPRTYSKCFIFATHKAFREVQASIVESLRCLTTSGSNQAETKHRILLLRRLMDAIAFCMLNGTTNARKISKGEPASLNFEEIDRCLMEANRRNAQSLWIFALLSDLTTFINIGDILQLSVDERTRQPSIKIIELKTGVINNLLRPHVKALLPLPESLPLLSNNPDIPAHLLPQAERMLKQEIRISSVDSSFKSGKNTKAVRPFRYYDDVIGKLATTAKSRGAAGSTIDGCLHLGMGYGPESKIRAQTSVMAEFNIHSHQYSSNMESIKSEFRSVDLQELIGRCDLVHSNLHGQSARSLFLWRIPRAAKMALIKGELSLIAAFNTCLFIDQVRTRLKLAIGVEPPRISGKLSQDFGRTLRKVGNQYIYFDFGKERFWFSDTMVSRFLHELIYPVDFMQKWSEAFAAEAING